MSLGACAVEVAKVELDPITGMGTTQKHSTADLFCLPLCLSVFENHPRSLRCDGYFTCGQN